MKQHVYSLTLNWTGNSGSGTSDYRAYSRNHEFSAPGKPVLAGSSDSAFRGDATRYSPEELLLAALSSCHMLWYLHLCAEAGIVVTHYTDSPQGTMIEEPKTGGRFTEVTLRPSIRVQNADKTDLARQLHERAHALCFIANSVNFPVRCVPIVERR